MHVICVFMCTGLWSVCACNMCIHVHRAVECVCVMCVRACCACVCACSVCVHVIGVFMCTGLVECVCM